MLRRQVDELGVAAWLAIQAVDYHDPQAALELMEFAESGPAKATGKRLARCS